MNSENFTNSVEISGGNVQGFIQENHGTVTQYFISQVSELLTEQTSSQEQPLSQEEYRNKKVLLSKVKQYWIEGVLNKSLHTQAMIQLDLEERADLVERSVSGFEELPKESRQILPKETDATEFFNQIGEGRTLLILGEPGAGKTITLLKLVQDLIPRAQENLIGLIPVVFSLSSWASKRQTIADWLVQELWKVYGVSPKIGQHWVEKQQLLLLLDGLDEVKTDCREACVQAINQFMQEHGQTEMVVCSRIADYESLSARLQLRGAIFIRSLTPEQVNQYLERAGEKLQAVKTLLQEDTALQELAKSPLTLSVMTLAYQGKKIEELPHTGSVEERRQDLFNTYIERMFKQEKIGKSSQYQSPYQNQQTKLWLIWLAQRMSQASQTIFLIEQMQPTWLPSKAQRIIYRICSGLMGGLIVGLVAALIDTLIVGLINGLFVQDTNKLAVGLLYNIFISGFISAGLVVGLIIGLGGAEIKSIQSWKWSWREAKISLPKGIIFGLILGLFVGSINILQLHHLNMGLMAGLMAGLMTGLMGGLIYCITQGLKGSKVETTFFPNQGIWQSAKTAVFLGLIGGLTGGLIASNGILFSNIVGFEMPIPKLKIISFYLVNGILLGVIFGGIGICVKHLTLRLILHRNNYIPWNYAHFLDYASDRIFLQKVGGGYLFIHRMLLEYFALLKID